MVGAPKHLSDLDRIKADVRITCRECGYEEDWTLDSLKRHLVRTSGSQSWTEITRGMRCRRFTCCGTDLYPLAVPFARKPPNLPRKVKPLDGLRITLALQILDDAAQRAQYGPVATADVRLALYVLHPFLRDARLVRDFWRAAERPKPELGECCHQLLRWINARLRQQGWLAAEI